MSHYMNFDRSLIRARNAQVRRQVQSLRLQERLRKNRNPDASRPGVAPIRKAVAAFILIAVATGGLLAVAAPAGASTTFVVDSTADRDDYNLTDDACAAVTIAPLPGIILECTLRAAIQQANATSGEGKKFVGQKILTTDASGNSSFTFKKKKVSRGQFVTATATSSSGDTSEFSNAEVVRR